MGGEDVTRSIIVASAVVGLSLLSYQARSETPDKIVLSSRAGIGDEEHLRKIHRLLCSERLFRIFREALIGPTGEVGEALFGS